MFPEQASADCLASLEGIESSNSLLRCYIYGRYNLYGSDQLGLFSLVFLVPFSLSHFYRYI